MNPFPILGSCGDFGLSFDRLFGGELRGNVKQAQCIRSKCDLQVVEALDVEPAWRPGLSFFLYLSPADTELSRYDQVTDALKSCLYISSDQKKKTTASSRPTDSVI